MLGIGLWAFVVIVLGLIVIGLCFWDAWTNDDDDDDRFDYDA
ncbi:hypothetical protein [Paraburkholderia fungorum]|nr:hypothetical protein [Paraburkholderia fungorum]MBB5543539.1 putative membrane protein YedE/YeeE [Paraburkholderia fungorum]